MDFLELAKNRYSVRSFRPDPVPEELIEKVLEAAYVAPTACNKQAFRVLAVTSPEGMARFRRCTACHFGAPMGFIICADRGAQWVRPFDGEGSGVVDASIVTTHMMLEAASLGLGSTWVMYFEPEAVYTEFALPDRLEPVALLPMGYPSQSAAPSELHTQYRDPGELTERC